LSALIDDFQGPGGRSALGTTWQGLTDRVMGGRSDMEFGYRGTEGRKTLFMRGKVRLDNSGGFLQVRLPLADDGRFDASAWAGIRLTLRGAPGPYYVHLRTVDTRQPWAHYRAPLPVGRDWQTVDVPFDTFRGVNLHEPLDRGSLVSLGIVAYGERFDAELEMSRLSFVLGPDQARRVRWKSSPGSSSP
jgi:hypothetical protein